MVTTASIHAHDFIGLLAARPDGWLPAELQKEVEARFGASPRFHTCSMEGLSTAQLLEFLQAKGKVVLIDGRLVKQACSCGH